MQPVHRSCCNSKSGKITKENCCFDCIHCYTYQLLERIHPSKSSQKRRLDIFEKIENIFKKHEIKCYLFGSVGLKTYLPDGDIDIALDLGDKNPSIVCKILEQEMKEHNIEEITFINAEVKLVKCKFEGMSIDMTINQIGGVITLQFLNEVDKIFGHDHLLKKCLILLKAWSYYEAHILGGHIGMLSTYSITTMLINIMNFKDIINLNPIEILNYFFEYYRNFDFSKPIQIETTNESIITDEFLNKWRLISEDAPFFKQKYLNIIDPLRPKNNIGKSVSNFHFHRIKQTFKKGNEDLNNILNEKDISNLLSHFFKNTWEQYKGDYHLYTSKITSPRELIHLESDLKFSKIKSNQVTGIGSGSIGSTNTMNNIMGSPIVNPIMNNKTKINSTNNTIINTTTLENALKNLKIENDKFKNKKYNGTKVHNGPSTNTINNTTNNHSTKKERNFKKKSLKSFEKLENSNHQNLNKTQIIVNEKSKEEK
eukprot:gene4802-8388_t